MKPLGTRVLVRELDVHDTSPGGIVLLDDTLRYATQEQGEVVVAGKDCDPRLKPGTWILHKPFARAKGPEDGQYWILEDEIIAVIDD